MHQTIHILILTSCMCLYVAAICHLERAAENDKTLSKFLQEFDEAALKMFREYGLSQWDLETNMTDYNKEQFVKVETQTAKFLYDQREVALKINTANTSADHRRQLEMIKNIGAAAQPNITKFAELSKIRADMEYTYSKAKVCLGSGECLPMEPDLGDIMATSRDYDKLLTVWEAWRNESGKKIRQQYAQFVEMSNENVRNAGYNDTGEQWRSFYESDTLEKDVNALYKQIKPLYEQLHAYTRKKLKEVYGANRFPSSGHIPAHILGNMWAQQWDNIYDLLTPYKNKTSLDVTAEMVRQNYTSLKMFKTAEEFLTSLGFEAMTPTFWNLSVLEKPTDGRQFSCGGSTWDMYNKDDFSGGCLTYSPVQFWLDGELIGDSGAEIYKTVHNLELKVADFH